MFFSRCKPQKKEQLLCVGGSSAGRYVSVPEGERTFEITCEINEGWVKLWKTESYRLELASGYRTGSRERVSFLLYNGMSSMEGLQELLNVYALDEAMNTRMPDVRVPFDLREKAREKLDKGLIFESTWTGNKIHDRMEEARQAAAQGCKVGGRKSWW